MNGVRLPDGRAAYHEGTALYDANGVVISQRAMNARVGLADVSQHGHYLSQADPPWSNRWLIEALGGPRAYDAAYERLLLGAPATKRTDWLPGQAGGTGDGRAWHVKQGAR